LISTIKLLNMPSLNIQRWFLNFWGEGEEGGDGEMGRQGDKEKND
jgi:hypothetical protein